MLEVQTIRIFIVDYHAVMAMGVSAVLGEFQDFDIAGCSDRDMDSLTLIDRYRPDIVIMDIDISGEIKGMDLIRTLRDTYPQIRILIFTNLLDEAIVNETLRNGANGYLLKNISTQELVHAIRTVYEGKPALSPEITQMIIREVSMVNHSGPHLTHREAQVLDWIVQGKSNQEIAKGLNISLSTVQFHVSNILDKLDVHNRIEAAIYAVRNNLAS